MNNQVAVELHRAYALEEKKFGIWGMSPCSVAGEKYGGYSEFGVPGLGVKGYKNDGVITPHVSFLALETNFEEAMSNIREMLSRYPIYGEYGLYDSIIVESGEISYRYLALDQAMTFISLVNYFERNSIKKRFHCDPIIKEVDELLGMEAFFE